MKTRSIHHLLWSIFLLTLFVFVSCQQDELSDEIVLNAGMKRMQLTSAANLTASNGAFTLINRQSGKALDVDQSLTTNGANIVQWTSNGGDGQQWVLNQNADGFYSIVNVRSGKGLDVVQSGTENGTNVVQWSYWGGANQQWEFIDLGNGYYEILNRNSGKALDVSSGSLDDGANVLQWSYWGGLNQQWSLDAAGAGNGQLTWTLVSSNVPSDALARITAAMDAAVIRYNVGADWPSRTLTVEYNTGVATADANINGHIRFGANSSYQNVRTALHEIAHTYGVGTSSAWSSLTPSGVFVGANTDALIKIYNGSEAVINTGGSHFWPYGLNYDNEWSELNAKRHVQIVRAMVQDGL